jgi:Mn-dependent DtxR family transcriptional regulator
VLFTGCKADGSPLPLGDLQEHFGFSPISIHEMIQKLVQRGLVEYLPYKGVVLTPSGSRRSRRSC